jgi:hypothetical protein
VAERTYSPRLRTAVVLCGAGTAGAYQAGVLRALTEAGVSVDLLAAHGPGVLTALCAAIDGAAQLWDPAGPWLSGRLRHAYRWRAALRAAGWALAAAGLLILSPLVLILVATTIYAASFLAALMNLADLSQRLVDGYQLLLAKLFNPPVIPTIVPRAVVLAGVVVLVVLVVAAVRSAREDHSRRRWAGRLWWHLIGSPLETEAVDAAAIEALWRLVRGASTEPQPGAAEMARRYLEILGDNLGQPRFRELLLGVHDIDARRDLVGAVLPTEARATFMSRRKGMGPRDAEVVDLCGPAKDLVVDFLRGAIRLPIATAPHTCDFPTDSYWRGESHRLTDRPELAGRLIEEIASLGVEQVVLISPAEPAGVPHGLRARPLDMRSRMGQVLRSVETAALQDAWTAASNRFSGVFVIRPDHNPIGPFDFSGTYDPASDRKRSTRELVEQGYRDAYQQFIEPVVAAGERVEAL